MFNCAELSDFKDRIYRIVDISPLLFYYIYDKG